MNSAPAETSGTKRIVCVDQLRGYAIFGMLHGMNALLLFSLAVMAGKRVSSVTSEFSDTPAHQAMA